MRVEPKPTDSDLHTTLWLLGRFTLLPELLDFFDYECEKFLNFIDRFGGMTLEIPSRHEVGSMARNIHIYRSLSVTKTPAAIQRLADFYGMTAERIREIGRETKDELEKLDLASGQRSEVASEDEQASADV